jgi:hypothetical protein
VTELLKPRSLKKTNPELVKFDKEIQTGKRKIPGLKIEITPFNSNTVEGPLLLPDDREPIPAICGDWEFEDSVREKIWKKLMSIILKTLKARHKKETK